MDKKLLFILSLLLVFIASDLLAQRVRKGTAPDPSRASRATIGVTDLTMGPTANDMVTALLGPGISYSNVSYVGAPNAAGFFTNGLQAGLEISDGIMLSSGSLGSALGPNTDGSTSVANATIGDDDLTDISGEETHDASVLEFDFIPTESVISFSFIFASEEYPEYVGSVFNDVFAFFLNGSNIAYLPGTSVPITINTVNGIDNSVYYFDNDTYPGPYDIQADGFLTRIFLEGPVNPGVVNHIKFAIADASDEVWDSWVFLKAGSFASGNQPPEADEFPEYVPVINIDQTYAHDVEFHAPEYEQTTDVVVNDGGLPGFWYSVTPGNPATVHFELFGMPENLGLHTIQFIATDDGEPPLSTIVNFQIEVVEQVPSPDQRIDMNTGWCGISSYIIPNNPALESIFTDVVDNLIIMQNFSGIFWPSQGINTLGGWNTFDGYAVKNLADETIKLEGALVEPQNFNIYSGWSYLPVLSTCDVAVEAIFANYPEVEIIKDIAGNGIYWPEFGINTIEYLIPGKAYFISVSSDITISFPACANKNSSLTSPKTKPATPWAEAEPTPASHIIGFNPGSLAGLMSGDIVGVFTPSGICAGLTEILDNQAFNYVTAFGDDYLGSENQGLKDGEELIFRVYRPSEQLEIDLDVTFVAGFRDNSRFTPNGISMVKDAKYTSQAISEISQNGSFEIYPNPGSAMVALTIHGIADQLVNITVVNPYGSLVHQQRYFINNGQASINLNCSSFPKGVYLINVKGDRIMMMKKLVVE